VDFAKDREGTLLALTMGLGKSRVAVDLSDLWDSQTILILAPLSALPVWRREFRKHGTRSYTVGVCDKGGSSRKLKIARNTVANAAMAGSAAVVAINYESAWRGEVGQWVLGRNWDLAICDESHRIKAGTSKVSKWAAKLAPRCRRRLALTGTPLPNSALDIFGQARFVAPEVFPPSWHQFQMRYAEHGNPWVPQQITSVKNLIELQAKTASFTHRAAGGIVKLPEAIHDVRSCVLPPAAREIYEYLRQQAAVEVEGGLVTAANALTKTIRLRQLVSGYLPLDDGKGISRVHDEKKRLLSDLIEDSDERLVVFAEFTEDLRVVRELAADFRRRYGEISGSSKDVSPDGTFPLDKDILGVQYRSGSEGIDLTAARIGVFYSLPYAPGTFDQAKARLHRPGQTRTVNYYSLICEGTVDEAVQRALEGKADTINAMLEAILNGVRWDANNELAEIGSRF
jgi:SNF2 family DNA or RNA helicase